MKKYILILIGVMSLSLFQSCTSDEKEDDYNIPESNWTQTTTLSLTPTDPKVLGFIYSTNISTGQSFWSAKTINYKAAVNFKGKVTDISSIDFYIFAEEKVNGNYIKHGGNQGILFRSITTPDLKNINLSVTKDEVYNIFKNFYKNTNRPEQLLIDDVYELKWVIKNVKGEVIDTRNSNTLNSSYGFKMLTKQLDTWIGDFNAKWIVAGSNTLTNSFTKVKLGDTRTIVFSKSATVAGGYDISDLSAGGSQIQANAGNAVYNATTKTLTLKNTTAFASKWEMVSVTPTVLTIKWTYYYSAYYPEFGTFEITRGDGLSWPTGITIVNN